MQETPVQRGGARSRPGESLRDFLVAGGLLALLLLAILRLAVPTFQGWYHEDDLHNLRWILEYRTEPWRAFTDRHMMHDHIRPFTLVTLWLGASLSDGAYWGQHLLLVLLLVGGLAGILVLGRALAGTWRAGLLAALLGASASGWARIMDWHALTNSAGEVFFGVWGLVAAHYGLRRGARWLLVAAIAMVVSALYKEPGSFIYPAAAAAMAWGAWRAGQRDRRPLLLLGTVPLGLLAFAYTWHPANVSRMRSSTSPVWHQMLGYFEMHPKLLLNLWPAEGQAAGALGSGVPVVLLALVVLRDLFGPERLALPALRLAWLAGALGFWAATVAWTPLIGFALLPLVVLTLLRRWSAPPPGLVMYLVSIGVISPFSAANDVQIVAASHGLALYTAMGMDGILRDRERIGRTGAAMAWGGVALVAALLFGRVLSAPNLHSFAAQREAKHRLLGYGALARTLGTTQVYVTSMSAMELEVLPLVGIELSEPSKDLTPTVSVSDGLLLSPAQGAIERAILPNDLLQGIMIPVIQTGQSGGAGTNDLPQGSSLDVAPGYYALGIGSANGIQIRLALVASDACGNTWTAQQDRGLLLPFALTPMYVEAGCAPIEISWQGDTLDRDGMAFLAPLVSPVVSLKHPVEVPRVLPVKGFVPNRPSPPGSRG